MPTSEESVPLENLEETSIGDSFSKGSRKSRQQEAENIRQEYIRRTGPLPRPRPKQSSDGEELNPPAQ